MVRVLLLLLGAQTTENFDSSSSHRLRDHNTTGMGLESEGERRENGRLGSTTQERLLASRGVVAPDDTLARGMHFIQLD